MDNINYNPDVLDAIANLSNDEVFTPPKLVNKILDMLPQELFKSPTTTFLDPVSKSGVFLREIAKRLMKGLEKEIPDVQTRANHIFKNQLFGIAITELTSLLSRRTLYGTKTANNKYSFCTKFKTKEGNILFSDTKHSWKNGKCIFCGASKEVYDRDESLESYAYEFIHTEKPQELFGMKFDVIIGNPPYQLNDGGGSGTSAKPIYHLFVKQAKKLNPRFLVMIIPARWYSGGKGLDEFRIEMLKDKQIREIHDFPDASDVFPGVQIKGGVCYFLFKKDDKGLCKVYNYTKNGEVSVMQRQLLENGAETFIRYNKAISILKKVQKFQEVTIDKLVSTRMPFGILSTQRGKKESFKDSLTLFHKDGLGFIDNKMVSKNRDIISRYKVFIPKAGSGSDSFPHSILGKPFIGFPNSVCTETYLFIGPFDNKLETENVISYIKTKFFRFLVLLIKSTQNTTSKVYSFVPMQDFTQEWTDEKLYKKYGLTQKEIDFIESMIKPME